MNYKDQKNLKLKYELTKSYLRMSYELTINELQS